MSAREPEGACSLSANGEFDHDSCEATLSTEGANHDIMSLMEKQAAAKQTFVFLGSLANEYPAKQDVERDSADS